MVQVHYSRPGEGTELAALDAVHTVKISATDTDGLYELFEIDAPRGHVVPPHRHAWLEAYYLLHGRMTATVDDQQYELAPGSWLTVPPQAVHTLSPLTPSVRFLVFTLSDAMGRFFTDLHSALPPGRPVYDVAPLVLEVAKRHGVAFAGQVRP